jgi:hypothetical protein
MASRPQKSGESRSRLGAGLGRGLGTALTVLGAGACVSGGIMLLGALGLAAAVRHGGFAGGRGRALASVAQWWIAASVVLSVGVLTCFCGRALRPASPAPPTPATPGRGTKVTLTAPLRAVDAPGPRAATAGD